jgi:hypothetical protein
MRGALLLAVTGLMLTALGTLPASAETVPLACSYAAGQSPALFLRVDIEHATVSDNWGTFSATVTSNRISWIEPAQSDGNGFSRPQLTFVLDRATGVLTGDGNGAFVSATCQRGESIGLGL